MTDIIALKKRRAHIKELLNNGETVDTREIARLFNSSPVAVLNDLGVISKGVPAYTKRLTTTENTRSRRLGILGMLTEADWDEVLLAYNNACAVCGSTNNITIDHKYPLSKGGANTRDNIQPLCKSCNSRKGNRE